MKNLLLFSLLALSINAFSQKGFNIEIMAQPGISMGGDYQVPIDINGINWKNDNKALTFGLNTGAKVGYNFNEHLGISLGLLYSLQGQNYKDYTNDAITGFNRTSSLNYFKIPLLFNFFSASEKKISFICSAGFYFGYLLGYKSVNTYNSTLSSQSDKEIQTANGSSWTDKETNSILGNLYLSNSNCTFLSKPFNSTDFGGILAFGLQYKISDKISIPLMVNYQIGFINIKNDNSQYEPIGSNLAVSYWQVGYSNSPNVTLPYHNSSLGLSIGLKFIL